MNCAYLLLSTPLAVAEGHSSSLRRRLHEISRAFGWWWGHVSRPYLRSKWRSSDLDIKVTTVKIAEIPTMAPSGGIKHVFFSSLCVYCIPFLFGSFLHVPPPLPYLSSYRTSSFCLAIVLMCLQVLLRLLAPHLAPTHPLCPSFFVVFFFLLWWWVKQNHPNLFQIQNEPLM